MSPDEPEVLAALDVGTNSFHLVVARVGEGGDKVEILAREKDMVRLGSGPEHGTEMKVLDPEAIDRAIEALGRLRQVAEAHHAVLRAVATSAVREAENRGEFLRRARADAGVAVEVISGFEEARLIHLGVVRSVPVFDRRVLVCDIGGGSTELIVGWGSRVPVARSFKVGAIRLTRRFLASEPVDRDAIDACRRHIRATITPFARAGAQGEGWEIAVGSSGTIEAVFAMAWAAAGREPPRSFANQTVTSQEIAAVVQRLIDAPTVKERAALPGLDQKRADIILAGALVLEQVVDVLGIHELTFSDFALREGVLLDTWQRRRGGSLHHLQDIRRRSVDHLAALDEDPEHSAQVARLALELFDGLADRHGLEAGAREFLEAGALLANVGVFVSHAGHHKHSYYLIRNSEHLTGFTDREIELIAQVARYHRKSAPAKKHPAWAALDDGDKHLVRVLAGILRVAVGLDRNHAARVATVEVAGHRAAGDGAVEIMAVPADSPTSSRADISLELYEADQRKDLLADVLDCTLEVRSRD